jgi:hypothetical protein
MSFPANRDRECLFLAKQTGTNGSDFLRLCAKTALFGGGKGSFKV